MTMRVIGVVGSSGSGKTTLVTQLIQILKARGKTVSTIKHTHHDIIFDQPGKDSFRHAQAGAQEVILASERGFALFSQIALHDLDVAAARFAPVDLLLIEGFRGQGHKKIEVFRASHGRAPLWDDPNVIAVASDEALPACPKPVLALNDAEGIADFIMAAIGLNSAVDFQETPICGEF